MINWSGRTIGGYQLSEGIGRGGMATVYRAYQPQLERWVAIKILQATQAQGEEFLTRFRREAKAIAALNHPNILTVYDYGEDSGLAYIVMEYVPGGSLKDRLTGEPMTWLEVSKLIIPVGHALAYAHSQGIVHRDVKPANILMAHSDRPLLADFGLVKLLDRQRGITQPGVSLGTPAYFSPEQAIGDEIDHRSDIYGLGIVLYELLTGHVPFESDSPTDMMLRRLREPPTPPRRINSRIMPKLEEAILHALAQDPQHRYPTMNAFVEILARLPGAPGRTPSAKHKTTVRLGHSTPGTGPRLVIVSTNASLVLPPKENVLIGRASASLTPQPDIDLELHGGGQAGVSRHHARLIRCTDASQGWLLEDLHSTNGTFLNEESLPPEQPRPVRSGDTIRCGQLTMMFYEE